MTQPTKNTDSDPVKESRRIAARVMIDMASQNGRTVSIEGKEIPIVKLMHDSQLIGAFLKIGLFSAGAQSFSDMRMQSFGGRTEAQPMESVPVSMIGFAFLYALQVSPKRKEDILKEARRIEHYFGPVPLDSILMSELASLTRAEEN